MEGALIIARFLQIAVAMLLWGAAILRAGAFPPTMQRATSLLATRGGAALATLNLGAALGWLAVAAALAGNGAEDAFNPAVLQLLLGRTHFGHVWTVHLLLSAALFAVVWRDKPWLLAAVAGANLASLGLIGHAVLPGGAAGLLHQTISILHLLAAGYWLGGLAVVLPCLYFMAKPDFGAAPGQILRSFSWWGHLAVAVLIASGLAKTVLILTARTTTPLALDYVGLLIAKAIAVCAMLALALLNRYRFVPRLAIGSRLTALRDLQRGTKAELVLASVVLVLVSVFATWSPFSKS